MNLSDQGHFIPKIGVIGVGGAGTNAINNIILSGLDGIETFVCNTDRQSLSHSLCKNKIQLGSNLTKGLGAGANHEVGKLAAEEAKQEILEQISGFDMIFVTAGMGGGTGTGAAPIIARIAKDLGILTVGVVTKPFSFEGPRRLEIANVGIKNLEPAVDTLIIVSNDSLLRMATEKTGFAEGFKIVDDVLQNSVRSIVELLTKPGFINRDFADLTAVMKSMGRAMIGYSEAYGEERAKIAAEQAISNPILENSSISGASSVLINITGGSDLTMLEVEYITNAIRSKMEENGNFLFGTVFDEGMQNGIRVSVIATGMDIKNNGLKKQDKNLELEISNLEKKTVEDIYTKEEYQTSTSKVITQEKMPEFKNDPIDEEEISEDLFADFESSQVISINPAEKISAKEEIKEIYKIPSQAKVNQQNLEKKNQKDNMPLFQKIINNFRTSTEEMINGGMSSNVSNGEKEQNIEDILIDRPAIERVA